MIGYVVPCWNYGRFLEEAVRSIAAQTAAPAAIRIVDDGSSDETYRIATDLQSDLHADERLPILVVTRNPERLGVVRVMNDALEALARDGIEWGCVVSADDWIEPTFGEVHERLIREHAGNPKIGFVFAGMRIRCDPGVSFHLDERVVSGLDGFDDDLLRFQNYVPGTAVVRLSAWDAVGRYREPETGRGEDHELWLRFVRHGFQGRGTTEVLTNWRRHNFGHRNVGQDVLRRGAITSSGLRSKGG